MGLQCVSLLCIELKVELFCLQVTTHTRGALRGKKFKPGDADAGRVQLPVHIEDFARVYVVEHNQRQNILDGKLRQDFVVASVHDLHLSTAWNVSRFYHHPLNSFISFMISYISNLLARSDVCDLKRVGIGKPSFRIAFRSHARA